MGILTRKQAVELGFRLSRQGRRVVLANGVFDLLHRGHLAYLEEAKKLGDVLFVAVNSDLSVRKIKGEGRPILGEDERLALVEALKPVDYAFLFEEEDVRRIILEMRPHYHAKGGDYTPESVPERDVAVKVGTKTVVVGGSKVNSTTDIIGRILEKFCK